MKITRNELREIIREVITERTTWKRPKAYFVAPKNAKYKDEKEVEKKFKRIPRKLKDFLTPTSTGIEINKKKFHEDAEELDENIDDGTEYYLEGYVVTLDKRGGKNLMRIEEFDSDIYADFAINSGLD
tara:strand:+ start:729 stop:1112 length:384 start_codon:yes stop_codon:yes gene_type:complete